MSDLKLHTESYDFWKLFDTYRGFAAPGFMVAVDGKDLVKGLNAAVTNLAVDNITKGADTCSFSVINPYDYEKNCFQWTDTLAVGKNVVVKMGYVDKLQTVFDGYITRVTLSMQEGTPPSMDISCMDRSFIMMRGVKNRNWENKTHSDIVKAIAEKYKFSATVTGTQGVKASVGQTKSTDYEFIKRLAEQNKYELVFVGNHLYFRPRSEAVDVQISLKAGAGLIGFDCSVDLGSQIGGVRYTEYTTKKEELKAEATSIKRISGGKTDGPTEIRKINATETWVEIVARQMSKDDMDKAAMGRLQQSAHGFVTGSGVVFGLPELQAGRHIRIQGLWGGGSRTFYVSGIKHQFNDSGFRTHFTVEGTDI